MKHGSNSSSLRTFNERVVLLTLRRQIRSSKADLARLIGLTSQSLTRIVDDLESRQYIQKIGRRAAGVGQPAVIYQLNPDALYSVGVKIGRTSLDFLLVDFSGTIKYFNKTEYTLTSPQDLIAHIEKEIRKTLEHLPANFQHNFGGIGIAMPWFLGSWADAGEGEKVDKELWKDFDIAEQLIRIFACPIYFENDCTAAAAAEFYFGSSATTGNFAYIYLGNFIGGGLVLNGDLERGVHSNAANIAALRVPPGKLCSGTTDWVSLNERASLSSLYKHLETHNIHIKSPDQIVEILANYRALIHDWMMDAADSIAFAIHNIISVLDLEKVIIESSLPGYLLAELLELISIRIKATDKKHNFIPEIQQGTLGRKAISLGGAFLPMIYNFAPDKTIILKGGIPARSEDPSLNY